MINLIAAVDKNMGLGYQNELLVKLPSDMKHFKNLTEHNYVVMGRLTHESIGRVLPNRTNIILTRNKDYKAPLGTFVFHSIEDVISQYQSLNNNESELFIIGGADIFSQAIPYADNIYLTIIEHSFEKCDSYFPQISTVDWRVAGMDTIYRASDEENEYDHYFLTYTRRK